MIFFKQPPNQTVKGGKLIFGTNFAKKKNEQFQKAQKYVDSEVIRRCAPLVPFKTGALEGSSSSNTRLGSGKVIYKTPYARTQYYMGRASNQRGRLWFERMKVSNKKDILKGAKEQIK